MGEGTESAVARVVAARAHLADEVDRLEAAGRAAVDIPAKIKRSPAKAAAVAGGGAFLVVGGPKRLYRRARRVVTGHEEAPLPKSLLPKDIEKALKKLGTDGDQVRGTIERDFSKYLDERAKERRNEGIQATALGLLSAALRPVGVRAGKQIASRMMDPSAPGFEDQLRRIRERRAGGAAADAAAADDPAAKPVAKKDPAAGPGSGVGI